MLARKLEEVTPTEKELIRLQAKFNLLQDVLAFKRKCDKGSFTLPELVGNPWPEKYGDFWRIYRNEAVAGHQLGKVLSQVCQMLGMDSRLEDRRGKKKAITRYFI